MNSCASHLLLGVPRQLFAPTINMDRKKAGLTGGRSLACLVHQGPDHLAIGFRNRQVGQFVLVEPVQSPFTHVVRLDPDLSQHPIDEHQPVPLALESLFAHHADEVESLDREMQTRLLRNLALGALGWALARRNIEFATYGAHEVEVGLLLAVQEQDASLSVAKVAEAGDAIGQW